MKRLFSFFVVLFLVGVAYVPSAFAHTLASDGNIGAVLHIDPNDDPIAGQQSGFFFEFKDKESKFTPQNCNCTFIVTENGKTIYSQPLFQNTSNPSLSNANVYFTFPQRDVYQVEVIGKPLTPNAFQPFTLTWNWRVDQQASQTGSSGQQSNNFFIAHIPHIIIFGAIFLGILIYIIVKLIQKRKPVTKGGEQTNDKEDHSNVY